MTLVPARHVPRVLLACDDPLESQLLRSLLRALPGPRPEVMVAEPDTPAWAAALTQADCCFLSFSCPLPLAELLARVRAAAPRLRVIGVLSAQSRFGDRAELVQALRAGMADAVVLEELSASALAALVQGTAPDAAGRSMATAAAAPPAVAPPAVPLPAAAAVPHPDSGAAFGGSWRIALAEQRASFDAGTLQRLGYDPAAIGSGLGDWKALIHADDIDRLVGEVHGVLNGSAPPHQPPRPFIGEMVAVSEYHHVTDLGIARFVITNVRPKLKYRNISSRRHVSSQCGERRVSGRPRAAPRASTGGGSPRAHRCSHARGARPHARGGPRTG